MLKFRITRDIKMLGLFFQQRGHLELWCLSSQITVICDGSLISWRWLNICLSMGNTKLILLLLCLCMWLLLLLLKCLHINPWVFWILSFLFSPWSYMYRSEWVAERGLMKPWQHNEILFSKGNWLCPYLLCQSCRRFLQQLFSNTHYLLQNDTCILEFTIDILNVYEVIASCYFTTSAFFQDEYTHFSVRKLSKWTALSEMMSDS